jgi:hypothetical protein
VSRKKKKNNYFLLLETFCDDDLVLPLSTRLFTLLIFFTGDFGFFVAGLFLGATFFVLRYQISTDNQDTF